MREKYRPKRRSVSFDLVHERYHTLEHYAKQAGLPPTTFVKEAAFILMEQRRIVPRELADQLPSLIALIRNIANSLNQIAKHTNTIKRAAVFDLLKARRDVLDLEQAISDFINTPPDSDREVNVPQIGELRLTLGLHQPRGGCKPRVVRERSSKHYGDSAQPEKPER